VVTTSKWENGMIDSHGHFKRTKEAAARARPTLIKEMATTSEKISGSCGHQKHDKVWQLSIEKIRNYAATNLNKEIEKVVAWPVPDLIYNLTSYSPPLNFKHCGLNF